MVAQIFLTMLDVKLYILMAVVWFPNFNFVNCWKLLCQYSIISGEFFAITRAVEIIQSLPVGEYLVCSDSQSLLAHLQKRLCPYNQFFVDSAQSVAYFNKQGI